MSDWQPLSYSGDTDRSAIPRSEQGVGRAILGCGDLGLGFEHRVNATNCILSALWTTDLMSRLHWYRHTSVGDLCRNLKEQVVSHVSTSHCDALSANVEGGK